MPRNLDALGICLAATAAGCFFDADYRGHYTCRDGTCPSGLVCTNAVCVGPGSGSDAAIDTMPDTPSAPALTCSDPGPLPMTGMTSGTTVGRSNTVSAICNSSVMNGPDAVYRIHFAAPGTLTLTLLAGSFPVSAYAIAPCTTQPVTPACVDNTFAVVGNPAALTISSAGDYYVVVDGVNAGLTGTYTLGIATN